MSEVQIAIIDQEDTQITLAVPGVQGPAGAISSGGSANQVFYKVSNTNYDAGWIFIGNANVDAAAAIAGTKISPNFGSQAIVTTGTNTAASFIPTSSSIPSNGIYLPGANQVAVATDGVARVVVNNNGLGVGISPNRSIDVYRGDVGQAILRLADADSRNVEFRSPDGTGAQGSIGTVTNHDFISFTGNTERLRITSTGEFVFRGAGTTPGTDKAVSFNGSAPVNSMVLDSSGRLGIGTSSPQAVLESKTANVQAGDAAYAKKSVVANIPYLTSNITSSALAIYDGTIHAADIGYSYDGTGYYLTLGTNADLIGSPTEALRVDRLGRVGIGTTSPGANLQVVSTGSIGTIRVGGNESGTTGFDIDYNHSGDTVTTLKTNYRSTSSNAQFKLDGGFISLHTGTAGGEKARIRADGMFEVKGAGTAGSSPAFSVNGSAPANSAIIDTSGRLLVGTSSGNYGIETPFNTGIFNNAGRIGGVTLGSSSGDYPSIGYNVRFSTATTNTYTYDGTDTAARIQFGSGGRIDTFTAASGTAGAALTFTTGPFVALNGTSWSSPSDERLKTDLIPIEDAFDKVTSLRAVTGRYKTDDETMRRSFLIAQDVQAVLPEAVDATNSENLGVSYTEVIPLLVAALKESKKRIEQLEASVATLQGK